MENDNKKGIFARLWYWLKNLTIKGLLLAIFVAFIIIILFLTAARLPGIIAKASSSLTGALYSVFVPAEDATMTANKKIVASGDDFTVTFKRGDTGTDGVFTIFYECNDNVNLYSIESRGLKNIECNKAYYLLDDETNIKIRAVTRNEDVVRLVLTGALENNDNQKSETVGVARITITNSTAGGVIITDSAPTTTRSTTTAPTTGGPLIISNPPITQPVYYGKPDLAIRVLQVGTLNTASNLISPKTTFSSYETVGIKFEVRNDGGNASGPWYFTAVLPSNTNPNFTSQSQRSLGPGESIQYTLGFNNLSNQYSNNITINVDPINAVLESNEGNNLLTSAVINTGYNNNNNNYSNGCYVNGIYTYNCNNNYYGSMYVSCTASPNDPETGDTVRWKANVSGGSGNYDYDWNGTNSFNSSSQNPSKKYTSEGTKYATVSVEDRTNNVRASASCSVYVDDDNGSNGNDRSDARDAINDAEDAIEDAEDEIDDSNASNSRKNDARDILDDARDELDDAEDAFDDEDYDEAIDHAEEAEDLAGEAIDEL